MSEIVSPPPPQLSSQTCKKCNLAISEGHAYELGDDRWHISCFKCFKCDKLLGCNSSFLVLGNGSLVCSNCSYSCKQCGKKIDDLAILTGDQAYCSNCFKCRVCKLKIEDLRYARTLKGLFCMSCHEELIAKKKKHDLKRKQLAQLLLLLRPSPNDEIGDPLNSLAASSRLSTAAATSPYLGGSSHDLYLHRNPSLSSLLTNKKLPPPPPPPTLAGEPRGLLVSEEARKNSASSPERPPLQHLNTLLGRSHASSLSLEALSSARTLEKKLLSLAFPNVPNAPNGPNAPNIAKMAPPPQPNTSCEIEEVNDSDDELNLRQVRENLERKFMGTLTESGGAILDLIDSFSPSNTPSTIYNDANANRSPVIAHEVGHDPAKNGTPSHSSRGTPTLRPEPAKSRGWAMEPPSPHKNILLLSPNQYHDNEFHSTQTGYSEATANIIYAEDVRRPRSAASSPMARANRQARVVETNEEQSSTQFPAEMNSPKPEGDAKSVSTPVRTLAPRLSPSLSSPPPRLALPDVPLTPKQGAFDLRGKHDKFGDPMEPKGLGLEGVDMQRTRAIKLPQPAVTKLEDPNDQEEVDSYKSPPSRVQSVRSKISLKHKRSTSNGSNGGGYGGGLGGKLGFFKSRDDASSSQKGHSRHVLDGTINGKAFTTPPLPYSSPMDSDSRRDSHARSTSDTNFITSTEKEATREFEMRSLKSEIYQLDTRRQALLSENMKLNSDKNKLLETLGSLQKMVASDKAAKEALLREVEELKAQRAKLIDDNESLRRENDSLQEPTPRAKGRPVDMNPNFNSNTTERRPSQVYESQNDIFESTNASESLNEEGTEAQKATRLKFWRRPKVTIANTQIQPQQSNSTSLNSSVGGVSNGSNSFKLGLGFSSSATTSNGNQNSTNEDSHGGRKTTNTFMTKSRSTTLLDSISSGQTGADAPLLSSTLQRRADFEKEKVPLIITKCIEEVEKRGLDVEGIYRLSGGNSAITAIENGFAAISANDTPDKKQMTRLNEVLDGDINAVTSALKRYLRKLPDPLIPFALYQNFVSIGQRRLEKDDFCSEFKLRVLNRLPPANKHALYLICKHLNKVNEYSNLNRMNFKNLSVVFAPTIARDATGEREMVDMGHRNDTTEWLFSNFHTMFSDYSEHD